MTSSTARLIVAAGVAVGDGGGDIGHAEDRQRDSSARTPTTSILRGACSVSRKRSGRTPWNLPSPHRRTSSPPRAPRASRTRTRNSRSSLRARTSTPRSRRHQRFRVRTRVHARHRTVEGARRERATDRPVVGALSRSLFATQIRPCPGSPRSGRGVGTPRWRGLRRQDEAALGRTIRSRHGARGQTLGRDDRTARSLRLNRAIRPRSPIPCVDLIPRRVQSHR